MSQLTTGFVIQPRLAFQNKRDQVLYNFFVSEANFVSNTYCERGQLRARVKDLAEIFGHSENIIRACINRLVEEGFIEKKRLKGSEGLLITVVNYSEYQSLETYQKSKETKIEPSKELVQLVENENTPFDQIENKFIQQRGSGLNISASDAQSIHEVLKLGIPLETVLEWMDTIYEHYIKRNNGRTIRAFKYYEEAIKTQQQKLQQPKTNVTPFPKQKKENSIDALARFAQKHGVKLGGTQDGNT
jgi:DNA-binding transcriptional regulator YhcF (GntR family)